MLWYYFLLCSWGGQESLEELKGSLVKKELNKQMRGDTPAGGKTKSGEAGGTVAEAVSRWKYYKRMLFYKPLIYDRLWVHSIGTMQISNQFNPVQCNRILWPPWKSWPRPKFNSKNGPPSDRLNVIFHFNVNYKLKCLSFWL